jgi:hypothetical protein
MNKTTLLKEAEDFRDQLASDLRAVEKFIEIARRSGSNDSSLSLTRFSPESTSSNGTKPKRYGEVGENVAEAIRQCKKNYNIRDVDKALKRTGHSLSRLSITNVLRRFTTQGKIREITPGAGRRPTVYTNVSL